MGRVHLIFLGLIGLIVSISVPLRTAAELTIGLSVDRLGATAWSAEGIKIDLEAIDAQRLELRLSAESFRHEALAGVFKGISLSCPIELNHQSYHCVGGRLHIADSPFGSQELRVSGEFVDSDHLKLDAQGLKMADGEMSMGIELNEGHWAISLNADRMRLQSLPQAYFGDLLPKGSTLSGNAKLQAKVKGFMAQPQAVDLVLGVAGFAYADVEGLRVAEGGELRLRLDAQLRGSAWQGETALSLLRGQFYSDPFFVEVSDQPIVLQFGGDWLPAANLLQIRESKVVMPKVMESRGALKVDTSSGEIVEAQLELSSDSLGRLYEVFIQPLLIGSMADELDASGRLQAKVGLKQGQLQSLHASLEDIHLDDRRGLFALHGVNGRLAWSREPHTDSSQLTIKSGKLYRIDFAEVGIRAHAQQGELKLEAPIDLPLMQGFLHIDRLHAEGLLSEAAQWSTSAQFREISLRALAEAFEWPSMEGSLNGTIPTVRYRDKRLALDGELVVDVFGGRVRVDELSIEEPLGRVPELFTHLQLSGLDLAQITQTFSFGHMQGGLEGEIAGLHLASWQPVAFDAFFRTPKNDKTPHRISQRAVDNLTALGNGVGSGLSSTFLGIFKEFRYDRIELRAKLKGNVAELDGMPHPDGGYYIVKGSGLPRIDVIARNRQVAWKTLLERLKSIRVEGMEVR